MKRSLWGVLIFLAFVFSSHTRFEITVHEQGCYYEGISVIPSENSGWLVSGAYNCDGNAAAWESCLVEIDAAGDTVAVKRDNPYNGIMRRMPDGNLVFAGGNHAGFVYDTAKVFKVKSDGSLIWEKSLFPGYCHHLLTDILPLEDGFLVLGNYAQGSCTSPVYDGYVAKLDTAGELVWTHDVNEAGNDQLHAVKITSDNHIAAFGWSEKKSGADDADYFLIVLDTKGNKLWAKTFGDERDNYGYGMDALPDGGFILNGHASTMDVMRLDSNGNLLWSNSLTETCGGRYFKAYTSPDGGYIFLGMEKSSSGKCAPTLVKTNDSGEFFWKKNFSGVIRDALEHAPGKHTLTGYTSYPPKLYVVGFDTTSLPEEENPEQIKLFSPNENSFFPSEQNVTETTSELLISGKTKKHIAYPNPSKNIVNIEFENSQQKVYRFEFYDATGKIVVRNISDSERITLVCGHFSKGIYTYKLEGDGHIFYGKILLE